MISTGQLAAAATAIVKDVTASRLISGILHNSSDSQEETVSLRLVRADGTSVTVVWGVLGPHESCYVRDLPVGAGDVLEGLATDADTVDYTLSPESVSPPQFLDSTGAVRQSVSAPGGKKSSVTDPPTARRGTTRGE
jgi:hypothetical protein